MMDRLNFKVFFFLLICFTTVTAQSESDISLRDVAPEDVYRDFKEGFSVRISGVKPEINSLGKQENGSTSIKNFTWWIKEGYLSIQRQEFPDRNFDDETEVEKFNSELIDSMQKVFHYGLRSQRGIEREKYRGTELIYTVAGYKLKSIFRTYLAGNDAYTVRVLIQTDIEDAETLLTGLLDSFEIIPKLSKKNLSNPLQEMHMLPQIPVVKRDSSDARDINLKGMVKLVITTEYDQTGATSGQRKDYYDEHGNLTEQLVYDGDNQLIIRTMYGFKDGMRVSLKLFKHYPEPIPDSGYTSKFQYEYDQQRRLIKQTEITNLGSSIIDSVYGKGEVEHTFTSNGFISKTDNKLDDRGNVVDSSGEQSFQKPKPKVVKIHTVDTYSKYDAQGNWTVLKGIKSTTGNVIEGVTFNRAFREIREITYYR